jgi:hypothetical protein
LGRRRASILAAFAIVTAALLLPASPAVALDSEVDSKGFAWLSVPSVADASRLWVEVEAPALTAENTVLMIDGSEVALRSTALGAGVILPYGGNGIELAVGLAVTASPDVALTVLDADGGVLFSDHSRIALTPVLPDPPTDPGASTPGGGDPGTQPGATSGHDGSSHGGSKSAGSGALSATGTDLMAPLALAMLAAALGATGVVVARKKAQR